MKTIIAAMCLLVGLKAHAENGKQKIVRQITSAAEVAGIDPDLALAIATVESNLNPNALGSMGEIGIFQLRPEYHNTIKGNAKHNILVGIAYLLELKTKYSAKYEHTWFVLFNYGPNNPPKEPTKTQYYQRVMFQLNKLKVQRYLAMI